MTRAAFLAVIVAATAQQCVEQCATEGHDPVRNHERGTARCARCKAELT